MLEKLFVCGAEVVEAPVAFFGKGEAVLGATTIAGKLVVALFAAGR